MSAALALQASLRVDQSFRISALAAFLVCSGGAIGYVAFERPGHTVLPGIDVIVVHVEVLDQVDHIGHGHAVPQNPRDQFGVVPVLFVKRP